MIGMVLYKSHPLSRSGGEGDAVSQSVLTDMVDYYRARAAEYDEWWERNGRYDRRTARLIPRVW